MELSIDSELEYLKIELEFARTKNPRVQLEDLFGMVGSSPGKMHGSCMGPALSATVRPGSSCGMNSAPL